LLNNHFQEVPSSLAAVVGGGTIGRSFAILFATAGHSVAVYDPDPWQRERVPAQLRETLSDLESFGLVHEPVEAIVRRVRVADSIRDAAGSADFVQECGPEREEIKRSIFVELDSCAPSHAILASASSAMPVSRFAEGLGCAPRCLIAHPANPPFLLRIIELVPAPFTTPSTLEKCASFFEAVGLRPILVRKEIEGFVFNRLQGAVLREAYCLVRDGVASVEDIDQVMRDALGLRWSVLGPFETVDLNTAGGIEEHARRMGPAYARMGAERGQDDPWTADLVAKVAAQRRVLLPLERREERVAWRDRQLMRMLGHRASPAEA
jgi:3-hydroxyacyl-CoA dehydrogenase